MSEIATSILDGSGTPIPVATFLLTNGDRSPGMTILQGDAPVSVGTPFPVGGTVAVSGGAINIGNLPGTQPVSGAVTVSGSVGVTGPLPAGTNSIGTVVASGAVTINSGTVALTGALPAGANALGTVVAGGGTLAIGNFPATQAVSGALTFSGAIPAGTNSIGTVVAGGTLAINNLPATQTVAGAVTIGAGANNIGTVVANGGTLAIGNFPGTQTVAGAVPVGSTPTLPPVGVSAVDGGGLKRALLSDANGVLQVSQISTVGTDRSLNPITIPGTLTALGTIAANPSRQGLQIVNASTATVQVVEGATPWPLAPATTVGGQGGGILISGTGQVIIYGAAGASIPVREY